MGTKEKLQKIVGAKHVSDLKKDLSQYAADYSLLPSGTADFVVWPGSEEEISQIVRLCNDEKIALVPVSSGVHFNGSTIPKEGGIVLDLARLNRIIEINAYNRMARIEPGVTWEELSRAVGENGLRVMMPLAPHPKRSVLTDLLEREVITNTVFDYGEPTLSMGVVWPTGEIFRTGSASVDGYPNGPSQGMNPSGPGLDFYRLLQGAQGTMGIVTWMNVKLESVTKIDKIYFAPVKDLSYANEFLHRILPRRIGQECLFLNNLNLASLVAGGAEELEKLRKGLPPWTLILVLCGLKMRPEERIAYEEKLLNEVLRNEFPALDLNDGLKRVPGLGEKVIAMLRKPWNGKRPYWKHQWKGGCQSLFFIAKPGSAPVFLEIAAAAAAKHGYPGEHIGAYIQPIEHNRACYMEFDFFYDPSDASSKDAIRAIYREAAEALMAKGAVFTRPYGVLASMVYERAATYTMALRKVKKVFDPNNIMNPGNLCF